MNGETEKPVLASLFDRHGRMFSEELGIDLMRGTPAPLFQWLCAALLMSARIPSERAMQAAGALKDAGWTTARHMADSRWEDRVKVLNGAGYARFDESAARMLGETADLLVSDYGGDLRRLRERAEYDPANEKRLLQEFKGIGYVGADIFLREVQCVWGELYPFADRKALETSEKLGLPETPGGLAALVSRKDFPRLVAALVRAALAKDLDGIRQEAS